ncbi:MAG: hypothetical protein ABUS56_06235 [Acidobacteriota bacterium]
MFKHIAQTAGFLGTCLALYTWFTAPKEAPQAEVYFADWEVPPPLAQQLHALAPLTTLEEARGQFFKPSFRHKILPDTSGTVDQVLGSVTAFVNDKVPAVQHRSDFAFKGYWRVTVRNRGTRAASAVTLRFPVTASGAVRKPADAQTAVQDLPASTTNVFALGNVQSSDEVVVYAWTLSPATADVARQITLTHDLGAGEVVLTR